MMMSTTMGLLKRLRIWLPRILIVVGVLFVGLVLYYSLRSSDEWFTEPRQPAVIAHREGEWEVTPLGDLQRTHFCPESNRLLVGCKDMSPELWDTDNGKRIAV